MPLGKDYDALRRIIDEEHVPMNADGPFDIGKESGWLERFCARKFT